MEDVQKRLLFNWSPEKAWFLGVLYGDGNVYKDEVNGDYRVSVVGSASTTRRWLDLIRPSATPKEIKHSKGTYQAYVNSKELVEWFQTNLGICGPKSDSLVWPEDLPEEFEKDFIRGLWDSDGSITIERRRRNYSNKGNDNPQASYTSKCLSFVETVREKAEKCIRVPRVAIVDHEKISTITGEVSHWHSFSYGGRTAMLVADYLYANPPKHLVNDDRIEVYKEMCALRAYLDDLLCPCGSKPVREGRCQPCWWDSHGRSTGEGSQCSYADCPRPVLAKELCLAHYNKLIRTGTPAGNPHLQLSDEAKKEQRRAIRARFKANHPVVQITVTCDWCKCEHTLARKAYDRNVTKNGRYICFVETGHLTGKREKTHLKKTNPYAEQGRKQCSKCGDVKDFESFDKRSLSWDGYTASCKLCASLRNKKVYESKKASSESSPFSV